MAALERIGLVQRAEEDAETLSVAEMRRLEIARAIATEPTLLLLDEMMAGLTATEGEALCRQIATLNNEGMTIAMVEHSVPIIRRLCGADIVLDFGRVLARGRVDEVLANPVVQAAYLGSAAA
jgi:branched-chain amino acid transport system ATP-binding protein